MGLRLRKSIKLGKHTRLNLSKSGVGVSTGVKGFRVGVGPKGVRTTASIPGTGISHTTQHSMKPKRKSTPQKTTQKVPIMARDIGNGKLSIEVYGEQIREQRADKPVKLTQRDYNKGMKIAKRHMKMNQKAQRAARRGGCLGCCISLLGMLAIPVLLIGLLLTMIL